MPRVREAAILTGTVRAVFAPFVATMVSCIAPRRGRTRRPSLLMRRRDRVAVVAARATPPAAEVPAVGSGSPGSAPHDERSWQAGA